MQPEKTDERMNDAPTVAPIDVTEAHVDWLTDQLLSYLAPLARQFIQDWMEQGGCR